MIHGLTLSLPMLGGTGGSGVSALISSINGPTAGPTGALTAYEGWTAQWASGTPPTTGTGPGYDANHASVIDTNSITVTRQGFDATGAATTHDDPVWATVRVREPVPTSTQPNGTANLLEVLKAQMVALSDYVYPGDTISGCTVSTTLESPPPVGNWVMPHGLLVGNSVHLEAVAFHRDAGKVTPGRQVACTVFYATDGVNTVSQAVSTPTISTRTTDKNPVIVHACDLDISSLTPGKIKTDFKSYPWFGSSASVLDTSANAYGSGPSPRYFWKDTAKFAAPPCCFVNASGSTYNSGGTTVPVGNDSTGVWSTDPAIAILHPFATLQGAIQAGGRAAGSGFAVTGGFIDNCTIYIGPGATLVSGAVVALRQGGIGSLTITRDPNVTRGGSNVLQPNSSSFSITTLTDTTRGTACIRFTDIAFQRATSGTLSNHSSLACDFIFDDVDMDQNSQVNSWLSVGATNHDWVYGMTVTNCTNGSPFSAGASTERRMWRGVSVTGSQAGTMEMKTVVGCRFVRPPGLQNGGTRGWNGAIFAFNTVSDFGYNYWQPDTTAGNTIMGLAYVQNCFEWLSTGANNAVTVCGDATTGNSYHVIAHNNTFTGPAGASSAGGRENSFYSDTATKRTHRLMSFKGNIHVLVPIKTDIYTYYASGQTAIAPTAIMNWAFYYAVGGEGEYQMFTPGLGTAGLAANAQRYEGKNAKYGTSTTVYRDAPSTIWTNYQAALSDVSAGAGGGTYTLVPTSPCKSMLSKALLPYTLDGVARLAANDHAGAYSATG